MARRFSGSSRRARAQEVQRIFAPSGGAQEVQRIAAIVNDEVISGFDLERRVELIIRSTQAVDSLQARQRLRPKALGILIDEKLRIQAAARLNLRVSDRDMAQAVRRLERQNDVPEGEFDNFMQANGFDRDSLLQQMRAEIAWGKFLRRQATPVSDDEVDEELSRLQADIGKPEYLISEIFLPVASASNEAEIQRLARELVAQLDGGSAFGAIARQYSRGATAHDGGRVGWIKVDQLADELAKAVRTLPPGGRSEPIRTLGGYYILQLQRQRRFLVADASQARVRLRQVSITVSRSGKAGAARRLAEELRASVRGCAAITGAVQARDDAVADDLGTLPLAQLSPQIQSAIKQLPVGRFSAPIELSDLVLLLMVCEREQQSTKLPERDDVAAELGRRQLHKLSQRFIRDLRRDAMVEYR